MLSPHEIRDVCQAGKDSDPGWYTIHRRLSIQVTARLLDTPITLRHISALMLSLGVLGAALNTSPHLLVNALGWACLYGSFLLDKVDGEVARFRRQQSVIGILLDRFHHRLVEPLLFLAVGWRASTATHSPLPLIAALATMLAANIIEETQHLPSFIATKHMRETRAWPAPGRAPSARWRRAAAWMRPLKTFRMFITVLPLVAGAELVEAFTRWPATTWLLVTSAVALWVYTIFQACYYAAGRLEADIDAITRRLPPLPAGEPAAGCEPETPAAPAAIVEPAVAETPIAWPLPGRPRRSVTLAVQQADAERARTPRSGAGPLAVLLLLGLLAGPASAGTYYVDGTSPQCSDNGPGTLAQPYCSISAAIAARGTAGNTILVQPGSYREMVTIPASGTSTAPIVLRANAPGVVIDGADDFSAIGGWAQYSGDVWVASSVTWSPLQVFADGARLTAASNPPNALQPGTYRYVSGQGLYVNAGGGNPGTHGTRVGHREHAFVLSGRSWITIDGFTATATEERSFSLTSSSNDVSILNCVVTFANRYGIYVNGCARVRIASCVVTDHNDHGIVLTNGSTNCLIEHNEAARNARPNTRAANGMYLHGSTNNTLRRNRWHDNQDTGEDFQVSANNNLSYENVSWNNGDHGYDHLGANGNVHFNDVAYGNFNDGFSIEGTSPGTQLTNCVAVNNGLATNEFDLWVDDTSAPGFVSNDNIFWNSTSQQPIKYIKTPYSTLPPYRAASGQDSRTLQADPRFVNPAAGNFRLTAGSPAIDNGNSSSPDWPATDADGYARVNDPSMPDSGLGPIPYSDRGAHEYQSLGLPPVAVLTANPAVATAPAIVTLDASGSSDPEGSIASYGFDFGDGAVTGPQGSPTAVHTYSAGTYTATVTVVDGMNLSASATATVISNQRPVAVLAGSPLSGRSPLLVLFDASGSSDADGTVVSYTFDFGDGSPMGPQSAPTVTHVYGTGNHQATVTATDDRGASAASAPLTVNVTAPDRAPVVAAPATVAASEGGAVVVDVTATDPDGDPLSGLSADLSRLPAGNDAVFTPAPDLSGGHLVWHPTYADSGSYPVTFAASNSLADSASTLIHIENTDRAPVVAAPGSAFELTEGAPFSLAVSVSDPDSDEVHLLAADLSGLPSGNTAAFTVAPDHRNGVFGWTPGYQDSGTYVVRWLAANTLGDTAQTVVHVANVDRAPVVAAPATRTGPAGSPIALNVTAGDPDDDPISSLSANLGVLTLGHGATFTPAADARSGVFSWTPAPGDTGSYPLVFTAANALNGSATTALTITRPNQAPTAVLAVTPATGNAPLIVRASASGSSDPEGGALSYRFDFGDGIVVGPQVSPIVYHKFTAGSWVVRVDVADGSGSVTSAIRPLTLAAVGPGPNLVGNPSFESDVSGWSATPGASVARTAGGFDGAWSLRILGPASLSGFGIGDSPHWITASAAAGARYRFWAWVSGAAQGSIKLYVRELAGGTQIGATVFSAPVQLTPSWQLVTVDVVTQADGSTLDYQLIDQPVGPSEVFRADNLSVFRVPITALATQARPVDSNMDPVAPGGPGPAAASAPTALPDAAPARFSVSITPSVASTGATLSFATTIAGPVRIELYDLSGRRVRRVLDEPYVAPGAHVATLDGRNDQGERLGDGIYFYRLQAAERSAAGRFVVVR